MQAGTIAGFMTDETIRSSCVNVGTRTGSKHVSAGPDHRIFYAVQQITYWVVSGTEQVMTEIPEGYGHFYFEIVQV